MSDSVRPHRRQPTRPRRPWDSPGKNTGVGCHFLLPCMKVKSESEGTQSCPVSDSSRSHGLQPTRLLRPWDFPGKSTGVGCHCLLPNHFLWMSKYSKYFHKFLPSMKKKKKSHFSLLPYENLPFQPGLSFSRNVRTQMNQEPWGKKARRLQNGEEWSALRDKAMRAIRWYSEGADCAHVGIYMLKIMKSHL